MEPMSLLLRLAETVKKYRHAMLVLVIGLACMLIPFGSPEKEEMPEPVRTEPVQTDLEARLEQILSRVSGAGEVAVLLTLRTGEEIHYQSDEETDTGDSVARKSTGTILIEDENHRESGLIRRTDPPVYLGALIVCAGADRPEVKLAIVEAVRCVTGLGADQITVVKMK